VLRISNALIVFCSFAALAFASEKSDNPFVGKWVIDKNSPVVARAPVDLRQDIKQSGSMITIESTFKEPADGIAPLLYLGIISTRLLLNTEGAETQNTIGPFQQATITSIEGNKMTTQWKAAMNGEPVEGTWVRTVSGDGRQMTLEIQEHSGATQSGQATLHFVRK